MNEQQIIAAAEAILEGVADVYYHGTPSEAKAKQIFVNGLVPPDLENRRGFLTPVAGMVYLTPSIRYGLVYALGGDYAGDDPIDSVIDKFGHYGYVFRVSANSLQEYQPDEDSVGELLTKKECPWWLQDMANRYVAPSRMRGVREGQFMYYSSVGKQLLRRMTLEQKKELLKYDVHIAHKGVLIPDAAWRVDKTRSKEYSPDGSNFFDVSERVL
jgi:hypothetical protein